MPLNNKCTFNASLSWYTDFFSVHIQTVAYIKTVKLLFHSYVTSRNGAVGLINIISAIRYWLKSVLFPINIDASSFISPTSAGACVDLKQMYSLPNELSQGQPKRDDECCTMTQRQKRRQPLNIWLLLRAKNASWQKLIFWGFFIP